MNDSIGIDLSGNTLGCHRLSDGAYETFANTRTGFAKLHRWIAKAAPARVVFEATGPYHGAFGRALAGHLPLIRVNHCKPVGLRRPAEPAPKLTRLMPLFWHRWAQLSPCNRMGQCARVTMNSRSYRSLAPLW